ncbi:MAG: bifunctional diaminohydroxyphosphoribosylaminopyrimidine deaminase/5-amino-6-(5-phosphoribosylamino)uracil reductase RibD [Elusimicrobiota bacterium]
MSAPKFDRRMMLRALTLAARGGRKVSPNPMVGCVIAKNGRVLAEGYHRVFGGPHAEAAALAKAGSRARGATAYVTLEPCADFSGKKTPACAQALCRAKISRVVAASTDPNPKVAGRGLAFLRRAGIAVSTGICADQARALNAGFFSRMARGRPLVILKMALSLDGCAFARSGKSRWITGAPARRMVHSMREEADAILVGIETVLRDNPALTSHGAGTNPLRVILDAKDRLPRRARALNGEAPTLVFTASNRKIPGAETVRVPSRAGLLSLAAILKELSRRGVNILLVEGGPRVHASFLAQGLADEARVFIAPKLISGSRDPNAAPKVERVALRKVGRDFLFSGAISCSRE